MLKQNLVLTGVRLMDRHEVFYNQPEKAQVFRGSLRTEAPALVNQARLQKPGSPVASIPSHEFPASAMAAVPGWSRNP